MGEEAAGSWLLAATSQQPNASSATGLYFSPNHS